jgi:hypothetical protein
LGTVTSNTTQKATVVAAKTVEGAKDKTNAVVSIVGKSVEGTKEVVSSAINTAKSSH